MVAKVEIVERLGERAVLLPALIAEALAANDRLKLRLALLQEAQAKAANPARQTVSLEREIRACGLEDARLSNLPEGARALDASNFSAPGAARLAEGVVPELDAMLAPLEAAGSEMAGPLGERLEALKSRMPRFLDDRVSNADVSFLTSARRDGPDTVHLIVMDLHKEINQIAAATAVEDVEGARAHNLTDADRQRVRAFMRGVHSTAKLAFGHPGLGTTAAGLGGRLTIQNDIGTTDAHVLVVHVEGRTATVAYSDVHRARAHFFTAMFKGRAVDWSALGEDRAQGLARGESFYLLNGVFRAESESDLDDYLTFLGSRLVFLIDWNKARKALQAFAPKKRAIEILTDAARRNDGHRAFLELGGAELVFDAIRRVGAGHIPYGKTLDEAIGEAQTLRFLTSVLHTTSEGLQEERSDQLIRDEIQAALSDGFKTAESEGLAIALRHLGLTRMLAGLIGAAFNPDGLASLAERRAIVARARQLEAKGDRLTLAAREIAARAQGPQSLRELVDQAENALDAFDEAAFLLSLIPELPASHSLSDPLAELSAVACECVSELTRAVEAATRIHEGKRLDVSFALQRLEAVIEAERKADRLERAAITAIMEGSPAAGGDPRALVLGLEIARTLEASTDRIAHAAMSLRDRILVGLAA